jgi:ABC-type glycerol-3-phosphate transport system permease component
MVRHGPLYALQRVAVYAALILLSAIFLIPLAWMVTTSFKQQGQVFANPPVWLPDPWMFENYPEAARRAPLWLWLRNTVTITVLATVGNVLVSSMVGFGFARLRAPGRDVLFLLLISTMLLPEQVTMIPHFVIFRQLGLIDTLWALIVPSWLGVYAFYVFLCRQFFMQLPLELDDAAKIDGCGFLGIYWRILMPLSKPVLASVGVFSFLNRWNDFLHAVIYLTSRERFTISIGLRLFRDYDGTQWHWLMAASVVTMLPCLAVFFLSQRLFVRGIATTGLKG